MFWKILRPVKKRVKTSPVFALFLFFATTATLSSLLLVMFHNRVRRIAYNNPVDNSSNSVFTCLSYPPCVYRDVYDLRIIVLTYKRPESLNTLLYSLNSLQLDGDTAIIEIWIDRDPDGSVDAKTVKVAQSFAWKRGRTRVSIHPSHVGIIGQWLYTWRPGVAAGSNASRPTGILATNSSHEIGLILEDDLSVSEHAYRWLKGVWPMYLRRSDVAGFTLQSEAVNIATNLKPLTKLVDAKETAFLYSLPGTWGYAPHPIAWRRFQNWFYDVQRSADFRPYVPGIVMTVWYKSFEKLKKESSMWSMWFIYFCDANRLFTLYSNIRVSAGGRTGRTRTGYLGINRREPGLHFVGRVKVRTDVLRFDWSERFLPTTPNQTAKFSFDGKRLNTTGR